MRLVEALPLAPRQAFDGPELVLVAHLAALPDPVAEVHVVEAAAPELPERGPQHEVGRLRQENSELPYRRRHGRPPDRAAPANESRSSKGRAKEREETT